MMGKTIHTVENAWFVFDCKVILHQMGNGMPGTLAKLVRVVIVVKVGMIRVNGNFVAKKKVAPLLKPTINSSKLLIIDIIVGFSFRKCLQVVSNCTRFFPVISLKEDGTSGIVGGIYL
jgi:hypothetical protein